VPEPGIDQGDRDWRERAERAERERDRERQHRERIERENERLRREVERLKRELDFARRAAKRQAAPFSKGAPAASPRPPGRRAGRRHGAHRHRGVPAIVHESYVARLPAACGWCGGALRRMRIARQYQEDLPVVAPLVRRFDVHIGTCRDCGRRVQGRHPLQTSDALGAAAVHVGPRAVAFITLLNKHLGLSHGKIAALLQTHFALTLTPSAVTQALHRAARQAQPTYAALCATVRGSPMVVPDETSWKVNGHSHWLWAFATPTATVYAIRRGRGFHDAAAMLGADFAGTLVRDGWCAYKEFHAARHQSCLAHLLRHTQQVCTDHPRAAWAVHLHTIIQRIFAVRRRREAGHLSAHGTAVARGHLIAQLLRALDHPRRTPAFRRLARHLTKELGAIFSCLFDATLDATNWRAEQALRPAVVNRKVCGGNRSARGAETQQILTSVIRSTHQQQLPVSDVLIDLLRARHPIVSPALQLRARSSSTR
jgi:transposase